MTDLEYLGKIKNALKEKYENCFVALTFNASDASIMIQEKSIDYQLTMAVMNEENFFLPKKLEDAVACLSRTYETKRAAYLYLLELDEKIKDYEYVKEHICFALIPRSQMKDKLVTGTRCLEYGSNIIYFYIYYKVNQDAYIKCVTKDMINQWKIDVDVLMVQAMSNTRKIMPPHFLMKNKPFISVTDKESFEAVKDENVFYVTNGSDMSPILYKNFFKNIAKSFESDIYAILDDTRILIYKRNPKKDVKTFLDTLRTKYKEQDIFFYDKEGRSKLFCNK